MKFTTPDQFSFTFEVLLIKIFFPDHWSVHLFQSNQCFQGIEFVDQPIPEKF